MLLPRETPLSNTEYILGQVQYIAIVIIGSITIILNQNYKNTTTYSYSWMENCING